MSLILETAFRTALADAIDDYINGGTAPELVFETSGDVEVATIVLDPTNAFGTAVAGVITMTDQPKTDASATGGTVAQFSIYQNVTQGAAKVLEGTVLTSGGDINLSSLAVGATDSVELTTFTITVPAS
jgi:hypothetical protein